MHPSLLKWYHMLPIVLAPTAATIFYCNANNRSLSELDVFISYAPAIVVLMILFLSCKDATVFPNVKNCVVGFSIASVFSGLLFLLNTDHWLLATVMSAFFCCLAWGTLMLVYLGLGSKNSDGDSTNEKSDK